MSKSVPELEGQALAASGPARQAVLVLGMHRSGTSAVAGVIDALGVAGPKTPQMPDRRNPRGYFESIPFFLALDALLEAAGSRWDDWRSFDPQWFDTPLGQQHRQRIKALFIEELGDQPFIYVKDPRLCRLVPFIVDLLSELGIKPVAVLPIRNPLEVAGSLKRRDNLAVSKSLLIWLRHVLDAEYQSRQMPRCFLHYESLLADWRPCVNRVADRTGVAWPEPPERAASRIGQFLSGDFHREKVSLEQFGQHPQITGWVRDAYAVLIELAADDDAAKNRQRLDVLRSEFDRGCRQFEGLIADLESAPAALAAERDSVAATHRDLIQKHDALIQECAAAAAERGAMVKERESAIAERDSYQHANDDLAEKYSAVLTSHSWRLTAPLRALRRIFK